ncbi:MAG: ribosomal RNA small subunit methyltransferase A [Candidatus Yanofskybacteria bacterium]|nr:ribosomal RNA small subunit methyltransferase A [Candidatus Yanofskybacteria bacterium]
MIKPLKKLGQNFLRNGSVLKTIVQMAEISANDTVLEVGAGTGLLTEKLAETGAKIFAVEKDRNLVPILQTKFKNQKNVTIIEGDILRFDLNLTKVEPWKYKVVGNIPYYLTSQLLRRVLSEWPSPKLILFMIQKEVAQRMVAKPPKMSLLALSVQLYANAKLAKHVSKKNFWPIPKVDSALIKISPKEQTTTEKDNIEKILKLAHLAFSGKRKQILNSLAAGLKTKKEELIIKLREAGIDGKRRPESLEIREWLKLNQILSLQF